MKPSNGIAQTMITMMAAFTLSLGMGYAQAPAKPADKPEKPAKPEETKDLGPLNMEEAVQGLYKDAASNFNLGKYDVALQNIGAIHAKTSGKDFEQVMFLEGACYFQMQNNAKAVEFLQKFVDTFPKSDLISDALINLGRALLANGDEAKGLEILKKSAASFPARKAEIGLDLANYLKGKERADEALEILESVTKEGTLSPEMVRGLLMMAEIYTSKGEAEKAGAAMERLKSSGGGDETIVQINLLGLKIGDEMRIKQRYPDALNAYQHVRRQSEILRIQKERVAKIEEWVKMASNNQKVLFLGRPLSKDDLVQMLESNKKILSEVEDNKRWDADLYFRLGQCFYEMQRYYECLVALQEIFDNFKSYPNRDLALYVMILCNQSLGRTGRAYDLAEKYMNDFPDAANITQVTDLFGTLAYQAGKIDNAIKAYQRALASKGADQERLNFMLGVTLFEATRFDDARTAFQALLQAKADSGYKDDAEYRIALTYFFQNDSPKALKSFREYIAGNPKGNYVVDARYRIDFIEYQMATTGQGGGDLAKVRGDLETLAAEFPIDQNIGQVWTLLGDIYGRMPNTDTENFTQKSMKAYMSAVEKAKTPDVLDYAIDAATNLLQSEGKWTELASMWQTYYTSHKDSPGALKAIHWISRAKVREGKPEDAQQLLAEAIIPNLGDPKNEQVEVLMQQLVGLIVPKKGAKKAPKPAAPKETPATESPAENKPAETKPDDAKTAEAKPAEAPAPTIPAAAPQVSFEQVEERFKKLLTPAEGEGVTLNATAQARILYGRALIARFMRDIPKYENLLSVIPDNAKPEELSATMLAMLGDMLHKKGQNEKAVAYYNQLRESFANSEVGDRAPVGLGEIEFEKKNYEEALKLFTEAIDKYAGSSSIVDATRGKARTLLELGRKDSKQLD
ncbi:MAG: tetratricopeptide repeat protein, partial [Verrucomicrobiaceae bacterium]